MSRVVAAPPTVRLTVDRVVVRGAAAPSRAALNGAIERAIRAEIAASPGSWNGGGSEEAIAAAFESALSRGLGGKP